MSEITLEKMLKEELIAKIQCYMEEELDKNFSSIATLVPICSASL